MPADVLIIEESLSQALRLKLLLERQNLKVDLVDRGQEGMAMAVLQLPSVVVLDANLPDINGQHICRALKDHPATMEIPVVLLLTRGQNRATPAETEARADAYVPKDDAAESNVLQAPRDLGILKRQEPPHALDSQTQRASPLLGGKNKSRVTRFDPSDPQERLPARQSARERRRPPTTSTAPSITASRGCAVMGRRGWKRKSGTCRGIRDSPDNPSRAANHQRLVRARHRTRWGARRGHRGIERTLTPQAARSIMRA